ncbi:DUF4998 domain-containing protein [Mucilaginibacter terrae]|uniref:DUF5000 domain-containing protein n=1 Tax=Mucilaginibacter terrae TaxID=1955052 RepID=A0ABU3H103_9SPHI|nr:DUF4998 domain-containing protein [Mucilaginibacter terrae]MDT3405381.1 hypothetical protein [Mucilaginibacter terrae]
MKNLYKLLLAFLVGVAIYSCSKQDTDFKNFLGDKEITYPGIVSNVRSRAGNLRTALVWNPSPDPTVSRYVIYWNNRADSLVVTSNNHNPADTIRAIVPNLNEYIYSFTIFSYDGKGNRSVPLSVNNVKVYGPVYQSGLQNRAFNAANPYVVNPDGSLKLNFLQQDTSVITVGTTIRYTNRSGVIEERIIPRDSLSITIPNYKGNTQIQYRTGYLPEKSALDIFNVSKFDNFATIADGLSVCSKSLFKEVRLTGDAGTYSSETTISKLWDGSNGPQGYPNIFHSDGDHRLPHTITFDMGKVYTGLSQVEQTGRDCCNNPDQYEIWGIADITNAATTLNPNDAGWPAEAQAKGWKLLKDVRRTDDGRAALKIALDSNLPPVRYIRVRIKHVTTGDSYYSNMSEMTFFNDVFK